MHNISRGIKTMEKSEKELKEIIKKLKKQIARKDKKIDEMDQVIKITTDIVNDFAPEISKEIINEKKKKFDH
ncbi:MAG: hypothetical protein LBV22_02375 [Mycoplasmataceae bacterium]|jgi:prefoldin subunit 5|nr:hypothetical protein [Mycoplasmataceae bacterium]